MHVMAPARLRHVLGQTYRSPAASRALAAATTRGSLASRLTQVPETLQATPLDRRMMRATSSFFGAKMVFAEHHKP